MRFVRLRHFACGAAALACLALAGNALAQGKQRATKEKGAAASKGQGKSAGDNPAAPAAVAAAADASFAWTLAEAKAQLQLNPRDAYLQYVALQLARREGAAEEVAQLIASLDPNGWRQAAEDRQADASLFNTFTGAAAIQESLQLDTLRGESTERPRAAGANGARGQSTAMVKISSLEGPTIKSHPWEQMLDGRQPQVSELARLVPADQYFVQCRSLTKLVELTEAGDLWAGHLFRQAARDATSSNVAGRLQKQLAVRSDPLTRPFYDLAVEDVAITGSDLYLREGSDVALIFRLKQPILFRPKMDSFLDEAEKEPGAVRSTGQEQGIEYIQVSTPDRAVSVFSAYPREDLHVRANSKIGLSRVLAAIAGKSADGARMVRLGETAEFQYIRTLFPEGAPEEDVLVYLSDPFIRRLVGPRIKLTERRRLLAYNHLRMIGHAATLFRTNVGREPVSLEELEKENFSPGKFGSGALASPFGGQYSLGADGATALCSAVGSIHNLTPCCELPLDAVTADEADAYRQFLAEYNSYWRTFFDPIAIRLQLSPEKFRAETIVLPLIDNTLYRGLAGALGGKPEPLEHAPVPKGAIFSLALKFDKETWSKQVFDLADSAGGLQATTGVALPFEANDLRELVDRGLGSQIGLHVYDAETLFDFNFSEFMGLGFGSFNRQGAFGNEALSISLLIAALNSPVYASIPVQNAEVVDGFLARLDAPLAAQSRRRQNAFFFDIGHDYYKLGGGEGPTVRTVGIEFGPIKWRFFISRIGKGLYIASKKYILDDILAAAEQPPATANVVRHNPVGHAMVRVRPEHWQKVLPDYQLGWAENAREAVLNNLGPLSNAARAYAATRPNSISEKRGEAMPAILAEAARLYGMDFLSPQGEYVLLDDGKTVGHSIYGSLLDPQQPLVDAKAPESLPPFAGATAELTFLEDGLHAVLTVDR